MPSSCAAGSCVGRSSISQLVEHQSLDVQLDQTEPESGSDWGQRAALYLGQHPVYALGLNTQLAERYQINPISETYDLWQVRATQ